MSPRITDQRGREQRSRILRAAALRFCRDGYHRTTIQDICDEAGLSKGGLYTYYKSKEELLTALIQESFTATLQRARELTRGGRTAIEKLNQVAESVVEGLSSQERQGLQSPQLLLEIWTEASKNPALTALYADGYAQWRQLLTDLLREGIAEGVVKADVDPDALVTVLLAVFDGISLQESVTRRRVDWRQVVEALRRGLTEGIVVGEV